MKEILFILIVLILIFNLGNVFAQGNVLSQKVNELAAKLAFAVEGYVVGVSDETVYINLGQESGIVEGIKFEVVRLDKDHPFKMGDKIIGYPETEVGQIEITGVRKEMSLAKINEKVMAIQEGDKVYQEIKKVTRIAITEFTYGDEFNDFTRNIQDILYTNLIQKGMTVVEREKINQVLEELGKSFSGMIDFSTAAEIGKMLGVEAIVVGTVADMGNSVDLRARLVDVEKGAAITAAQIDVVKDPTITGLLGSGIRSTIYGERGITPLKEAKTIQEVNIQNFNFKLINWQKKGEGIIFDLIITSEQDSGLYLYTERYGLRTRVFDDFGNEYFASGIQLGNMALSYGCVGNKLVTGVPMKAIISFDNFSPQTKIITLLEISCNANNKDFSVQIRNIPISK
ncbi:MAG: CsgG/HfaB family protein [Candidatus Atribacteria bacterium]|nr:CsgG/HfaB family protein [Candidatus Atribacteria bacterium]